MVDTSNESVPESWSVGVGMLNFIYHISIIIDISIYIYICVYIYIYIFKYMSNSSTSTEVYLVNCSKRADPPLPRMRTVAVEMPLRFCGFDGEVRWRGENI